MTRGESATVTSRQRGEAFIALVKAELAEARERALECLYGELAPVSARERQLRRAAGRCTRCGGDLNEVTPGCRTCYTRHYQTPRRGTDVSA